AHVALGPHAVLPELRRGRDDVDRRPDQPAPVVDLAAVRRRGGLGGRARRSRRLPVPQARRLGAPLPYRGTAAGGRQRRWRPPACLRSLPPADLPEITFAGAGD